MALAGEQLPLLLFMTININDVDFLGITISNGVFSRRREFIQQPTKLPGLVRFS